MGNNIQVPYTGHIPGGIHPGTDVVISGRTFHHTNRFSINLCAGRTYDQDCALHFNPRFDQNAVVRNSNQGGAWGAEETAGGMPFRKGQGFEIHMKVKPHGYHIVINQRHFCDFNHRLPKEMVRHIYIEGEVAINYIQFKGQHHHSHGGPHNHGPHHHGGGFPQPGPSPYPPAPTPGYPPAPQPSYPPAPYPPAPAPGGPIFNPPVPFTSPIAGGLYSGKIIYISGVVNPSPSRFTINMLCGPSDQFDIAMHLDIRFNFGNDRQQVIRTHKQGGSYGHEEKDIVFFPFVPNGSFEVMILTEPTCFKVAVNNQHFVQFNHRIYPFERADHVNVVGDCRLTQVRFQ